MDQKLDKKLCDDYPLLYKDRGRSMQETCMCWGFETGDGWFDLINEASAKLEKLIEEQLKAADQNVCWCGCDKSAHENEACTNKFVNRLGASYNCSCKKFEVYHARASQVKEKFGALRFYLDGGTKEMHDIIDEAEVKSAITCEVCGSPGLVRGGGWLRCLCDQHAQGRDSFKEEEIP